MFLSKVKNFGKLLLANILFLLAIVTLIEIGGQIYAYLHPGYKVIPFKPHQVLGWRFIPNSEHIITGDHWYAREFSSKVKINSHGFRDFERATKKNKDTIRVALLGDSMIAAREVDFEKTAGQLLEKRLNEKLSPKTGKKYEILNFGVPGYGVEQMYLNWNRFASKFNPDFIFLFLFENNYLRTISSNWCQRKFFGIDNVSQGQNQCMQIRPIVVLREKKIDRIDLFRYRQKEGLNEKTRSLDFIYIDPKVQDKINGFFESSKEKEVFDSIKSLPFKIMAPSEYNRFLNEQNGYLEKEMKGKRVIKIESQWFIKDHILNLKKNIKYLLEGKREEEGWEQKPQFTSGDKDNFPSWLTTNLANLKTLQVLGEDIVNFKNNFIIIDSFQFYEESNPPTQFASKWLENLAKHSNFGYIPLYKKLNKSRQEGNSLKWKYDPHLNELGNKLFADSMFDYLEPKLN